MRNEEIKDWMDLHTRAIKGEIKASGDMLNFRINAIEKKIDKNYKVVEQVKKETLVVRLIHNHPRKALIITVLIIFGFIFLSNTVSIIDLLPFIKP